QRVTQLRRRTLEYRWYGRTPVTECRFQISRRAIRIVFQLGGIPVDVFVRQRDDTENSAGAPELADPVRHAHRDDASVGGDATVIRRPVVELRSAHHRVDPVRADQQIAAMARTVSERR